MIRVFTLLFVQEMAYTHTMILVLSGLTMVTGVLGAVAQKEFRRILSFHIVSQIGYMTLGLGLFTTAAVAGSIFYIIHHIIVKTNLFLVSGVVHRLHGTYELKKLGGLYATRPRCLDSVPDPRAFAGWIASALRLLCETDPRADPAWKPSTISWWRSPWA